MPLQPKFSISQTESTLQIDIRVPFVKVSDLEYRIIDERHLYFSCKPYLLRLQLPGRVHDEEHVDTTAKYDWNIEHGTVFLRLVKMQPGETFEDLDMLSKLMAPKPSFPSRSRCVPRAPRARPTPPAPTTCLADLISPPSPVWTSPPPPRPSWRRWRHLTRSGGRTNKRTSAPWLDHAPSSRSLVPHTRPMSSQLRQLQRAKPPPLPHQPRAPPPPPTPAPPPHPPPAADPPTPTTPTSNETGDKLAAPVLPRERLDVPRLPSRGGLPSTTAAPPAAPSGSNTAPAAGTSTTGDAAGGSISATPAAAFQPVDASATVAAAAAVAAAGDEISLSLSAPRYGFADRYEGVLRALMSELPDVMDLSAPDDTPAASRGEQRAKAEEGDFDAARYAADAIDGGEDPLAVAAYTMQPAWREAAIAMAEGASEGGGASAPWGGFTNAENEALAKLPKTEYLLEDGTHDEHRMLCVLGGIMFASAFDFRLSAGDGTVESAWTLCKLSPALSWLQSDLSAQETLHACVRRAVTYGYMRSWKMARLAAADSALLLRCGRRWVLRQLLWVRELLERHDTKYVANRLWVNDMCVWVQTLSDARLAAFAEEWAGHVKALSPACTGWNLKRIVQDAVASLQDSDDETSDEEDSDDETSDEEDSDGEGGDADEEGGDADDAAADTVASDNVAGAGAGEACDEPPQQDAIIPSEQVAADELD